MVTPTKGRRGRGGRRTRQGRHRVVPFCGAPPPPPPSSIVVACRETTRSLRGATGKPSNLTASGSQPSHAPRRERLVEAVAQKRKGYLATGPRTLFGRRDRHAQASGKKGGATTIVTSMLGVAAGYQQTAQEV